MKKSKSNPVEFAADLVAVLEAFARAGQPLALDMKPDGSKKRSKKTMGQKERHTQYQQGRPLMRTAR